MNGKQKKVVLAAVILLFLMSFDLIDFPLFDPDLIDDYSRTATRNFLLVGCVIILSAFAGIFAFKDDEVQNDGVQNDDT